MENSSQQHLGLDDRLAFRTFAAMAPKASVGFAHDRSDGHQVDTLAEGDVQEMGSYIGSPEDPLDRCNGHRLHK